MNNTPLKASWNFLKPPTERSLEERKPFKCSFCDERFGRPVDVTSHERQKHNLKYENAKVNKVPKAKKRKKQEPDEQRKKARKSTRHRVHSSQWQGLINEWDDDKSKNKQGFRDAHPEIKNPQQRVSNWRKSILKKIEKEAEIDEE